jgi:hypothetical protein
MDDLLPCCFCEKAPFVSVSRGNSRTILCLNKNCPQNYVTSLVTMAAQHWNTKQREMRGTFTNIIQLKSFIHLLPSGWQIAELAEEPLAGGWTCRLKDKDDGSIFCKGLSPHEAVANAVQIIHQDA